MINLLQQISAIKNLPTLPHVVSEVQRLVAEDSADAAQLARVVECDPPLSAAILRLANSAFYGTATHRISSITHALGRIGFNEVRNVALVMGVVRQFSGRFHVLDYLDFWLHCLSVAYCADELGAKLQRQRGQYFFLAGLLHDIGILLYDQYLPDLFREVTSRALNEEKTFLMAENTSLKNATHSMAGAALLEIWKLDSAIVSAVRFHHEPHRCPLVHRSLAQAVHGAEYVMCNSKIGSFEGALTNVRTEVLEELSLFSEEIGALASRMEQRARLNLQSVFPHLPYDRVRPSERLACKGE